MREISRYPEVVEPAAGTRAPHLRSCITCASWRTRSMRVTPAAVHRRRRDAAQCAARADRGGAQVLKNGLGLLGVSAPEAM